MSEELESSGGSGNGSHLIVTGSSAGGIEALRALIAGLPSDLPAAVVVAQHLDPNHESHLEEILAHHSPLKVEVVKGRQPLANGTVYVIPPNHDVAIVDHAASLYIEPRAGAKPSIDRLFSTAAEVYGERLIGIVLSGMGSDGLAGAREIKEAGGTVIVQEASSASYPALPLLIPPNVVDFNTRPENMGALIGSLLRRTQPPQAPDEQSVLRSLLAEMRDRTGIDFLQYKMPTIMRRLSRLMIASGCETLQEYMRYLQRHPDAYQKLVSAFLIKVTEFFRDPPLYDELRSTILPRLIEEAVGNDGSEKELRIWSAGSSTGEEAYSLAMICAELLPHDSAQVRIFATDIDEESIAFARRGIYGRDALRDVPASLVQRYFVRLGDSYEVGKRIRNMTVFGQHDLAQRAPFPRIDLILCRNVLIYFTKELQTRALQLFAFALRDKGYLVLGRAESTMSLAQYFQSVNGPLKIYQRIGERILIPPARFNDLPNASDIRSSIPRGSAARHSSRVNRLADYRPSVAETVGGFVFNSGIGVVIADRRYDIVSLNPAARSMLQIHGVGVGEDLIHSAQGVDREALRAIIDGAFRGERPEPVDLDVGQDNDRRTVRVHCEFDPSPSSRVEGAALVLLDVTDLVAQRRLLERANAEQTTRLDELERRVAELASRQKALLKANDDLTMANAELWTSNEQLLITAEEAASSHEEVETLNEEMQATNEELETLNEELQATVEELNTTNDELQSRSADLESANLLREERLTRLARERDALAQLVHSNGEMIAIMSEDGAPIYLSPGIDGETAGKIAKMKADGSMKFDDGRSFDVTAADLDLGERRLRTYVLRPRGSS